jgi:lisH domain-containing protein FOPNL
MTGATPQLDDLKDALKDALERRGILDTVRAQLRRDIFTTMEDGSDARHPTPPENVILNELIREYLAFNSARERAARGAHDRPRSVPCVADYRHSLAVFGPEARLPPDPLRRSYVAQKTHLQDAGSELPLLYALLAPVPPQPHSSTLGQTPAQVQEREQPPEPMPALTGRVAAARHISRVPGPTPVIFTAGPP